MSRDREEQRKKRSELARQLGVGRAGVEERKELAERERVTRPALTLIAHTPTSGLLRRLLDRQRDELVLALYLVEAKGARLVDACVLGSERHEVGKLTYHRPAHFVVVVLAAADPAPVLAALKTAQPTLDGEAIASAALASAAWEVPRQVRIDGLPSVDAGAAVSIRGVGRSAVRHDFPLGKSMAAVEIEI